MAFIHYYSGALSLIMTRNPKSLQGNGYTMTPVAK